MSVPCKTGPAAKDAMLAGKRLGLLVAAHPSQRSFDHPLKLAEAALAQGIEVFWYSLDEAVWGLKDPRLLTLQERGLRLFACAYGTRKRGIPLEDGPTFSGLATLSDLMAQTDRFLSFA